MKKMLFSEYSDLTQANFKDENDIRTFNKICLDTYNNKVQKYSVEEANTVIRNKIKEIVGVGENPTEIQLKRAFRKTSVREAIFEVLETSVDDALVKGWGNDPFFKKYVDFKTLTLGDKNQFYVKDDCILTVSEVAPGHHNLERQRLAKGQTISVKTKSYGAKVYMEMSRFIQGVEDWTELVDAIARAFTVKVNKMIHDAVMSSVKELPAPSVWNYKGQASTANKKEFKKLISRIKAATGSNVMILGTDAGLGELTGFGDITWAADSAKEDVYNMGRLGKFEGTPIIEIPQALDPESATLAPLESDDTILIMPANIDKFIKMYYEGADEIVEHSETGSNSDDTKDYEFKSTFGVETVTNVRFGMWKFTTDTTASVVQ